MENQTRNPEQIPVQLKLSALWAALMSCYIYCDHLGLYVKGSVLKMNEGQMGPLGIATPSILVYVSILMAIPALMIALSVVVTPKISKVLNIFVPAIYIIIQALTIPNSEPFYILYSIIEIGILISILLLAFKWRKQAI